MDNIGEQLLVISIGILIGKDNPNLDINSFKDMAELKTYLNTKYNINVQRGMEWKDVYAVIEQGIDNTKFDKAMGIV